MANAELARAMPPSITAPAASTTGFRVFLDMVFALSVDGAGRPAGWISLAGILAPVPGPGAGAPWRLRGSGPADRPVPRWSGPPGRAAARSRGNAPAAIRSPSPGRGPGRGV